MSAPRAAAQLLRLPCRADIRSAGYYAGGDGAARHPYHRAKQVLMEEMELLWLRFRQCATTSRHEFAAE